jgi:hypothetical protein
MRGGTCGVPDRTGPRVRDQRRRVTGETEGSNTPTVRSGHGAIQPPPDSRNAIRTFGCRSHAAPDHRRAGRHDHHRLGDDRARAARLVSRRIQGMVVPNEVLTLIR